MTAVANGMSAFEELQQHEFAAILCDISMPVLNGSGFFEQLEERLPQMASRVVFITGLVDEAATREFLEQTGQPFLGKPAEAEDLAEAVERVTQPHNSGRYPTRARGGAPGAAH